LLLIHVEHRINYSLENKKGKGMLEKILQRYCDFHFLKEDFRKLGINFITAGIVGIFVNHMVGTKISVMLWASLWITITGMILLAIGLYKRKE
jgi:hypothetical protein